MTAREDRLLAAWPDGSVRFPDGEVPVSRLVQRFDFSGDHAPVGIFVAAGRGIRHTPARVSLSVLDVAPLLLYLAGQPLPDDLEGALPRAVLAPAFLAENPPRTIPAAAPASAPDAPQREKEIPDGALRERLRALGYED